MRCCLEHVPINLNQSLCLSLLSIQTTSNYLFKSIISVKRLKYCSRSYWPRTTFAELAGLNFFAIKLMKKAIISKIKTPLNLLLTVPTNLSTWLRMKWKEKSQIKVTKDQKNQLHFQKIKRWNFTHKSIWTLSCNQFIVEVRVLKRR